MHYNINIKKLCLFRTIVFGEGNQKKIEGGGKNKKVGIIYTLGKIGKFWNCNFQYHNNTKLGDLDTSASIK